MIKFARGSYFLTEFDGIKGYSVDGREGGCVGWHHVKVKCWSKILQIFFMGIKNVYKKKFDLEGFKINLSCVFEEKRQV
jgi:hypothetical protein